MMRDHVAHEIGIPDGCLRAHADIAADEHESSHGNHRPVQTLYGEHRAHGDKHDESHGGDYHKGHVDVVEVEMEIRKRIDHGIHDQVHDEEIDRQFGGEA